MKQVIEYRSLPVTATKQIKGFVFRQKDLTRYQALKVASAGIMTAKEQWTLVSADLDYLEN